MLLYLELVTSTVEVDGVFLCKVSPRALLLDWTAKGAFVCTLELATSTIEAEGVFICNGTTRAGVYMVFYN